MKIIQLELQLEQVNNRITELLRGKDYHWTEIAKLAIIVQKQELFKPQFTSFTAWVKDIAIQCDRQPSLIWRYIKASRYYLQLVSNVENKEDEKDNDDNNNNEDEDLPLERLDEIKAAPEALDRLEKVQRQAPSRVFEKLRDKVLNGKATVAECREIEKAYRPSPIRNNAEVGEELGEREREREGEAGYEPSTSNSDQLPLLLPLNSVVTDGVLTEGEGSTDSNSNSNSNSDSDSDSDDHWLQYQRQQEALFRTNRNRGRPKKGQEGSYRHLGQNKISSGLAGDDDDHDNHDNDEAVRLDTGELARNKIAPTIVRSLTVNLVDWTKQIASMRYPAKYYQDHTEVRVNLERQRFRLDFLAVVRWSFKLPKDIFVVEIKSCLQDFESDYKWTNYLNFCHYFCFATPLSDTDLLNAIQQVSNKDNRIGILGIDFQSEISEYLTYPVTIIKIPEKLKAKANKINLVYETLYERVVGWKEREKDDD